eukprot:g13362.t1 g13362   contig8:489971-490581(-)
MLDGRKAYHRITPSTVLSTPGTLQAHDEDCYIGQQGDLQVAPRPTQADAEVKGNIDDFFNTFDKWHTQLIGRGEDLGDALDCLWDGLKAAPCEKFSKWIQDKYDLHIEDDPTWGPITVEELTKRVKAKYNLMVTNKEYGSASKEQMH